MHERPTWISPSSTADQLCSGWSRLTGCRGSATARHGPLERRVLADSGNRGEQRWCCLGCGSGGTAIDLVMKACGTGYVDSLRYLADHIRHQPPIAERDRRPPRRADGRGGAPPAGRDHLEPSPAALCQRVRRRRQSPRGPVPAGTALHPEILVTEGILDALSANAAGYRAAAILSPGLADAHVAVYLTRLQGPLVLALDPDDAGQRATERLALHLAARGRHPARLEALAGDLNETLVESHDWPRKLTAHAGARSPLEFPSLVPAL